MNIEALARHLSVFADPATPFSVTAVGSQLQIDMVRDGDRRYRLNTSSGEVIAVHDGNRRYRDVAALLASEGFANIRRFKGTQRNILESQRQERAMRPRLEPEGRFLTRDGTEEALTQLTFEAALENSSFDKLLVVLLDGPAGIGKTSLIESIAYKRSDPQSMLPPLLHVTSGGSKLTDLTKALAHALQVVRAEITFDQVPLLARLGVIQVAIDGFDELVDPNGYKDAWSALREFLGDVGHGGPIVLSGRDTFFDQQEFERLLADRLPNIQVKQARLAPVSPSAAKDYLRASGWKDGDLGAAQAAGWFKPGSYQLRPFFLSQIANEEGWDDLQLSYGSPQSFLVSRMISREADIISRNTDVSRDAAEAGLWEFFKSIAEDMAIQQSDQVDEEYVEFACEAAFSARVDRVDVEKLRHRASSFAMLESGSGRRMRRFPHTEFQNQFAARALIDVIEKSQFTTPFIRQSTVNSGLIEAFSDYFYSLAPARAVAIYSHLKKMLDDEGYSDRSSSNIGALLLATLSRVDLDDLTLKNIAMSEACVVGVCRPARLEGVSIGHLVVTGADAGAVQFLSNSRVASLTVDENSVLSPTLSSVGQIQFQENGVTRVLRSPREISDFLSRHSPPGSANYDDLPLLRYFDRLCRAFIRQRQIRGHEDDASYRLLADPYWETVREVLGERIVEQTKAAGGPRSSFYRLEGAEDLLTHITKEGVDLRARIVELARREIGARPG